MRYNEYITGAVAMLVMVVVLSIALWIQPAEGHEHGSMEYDPWCCSGKDCAPAKVKFIGGGKIQATTIHGVAIFDMLKLPKHRIKTSQDGQYHACIPQWAKDKARCIYVPAGI